MPERCIAGGFRWGSPGCVGLAVLLGMLGVLSPVEARKRTGRILVEASVAGAVVEIDGEVIGQTPLSLPFVLAAGAHALRVTKAGHAPFVEQVRIKAGRDLKVAAVLEPVAAVVVLRSSPSGARVAVDGRARGVTPLTMELAPGVGELALVAEGFVPHREALHLVAGEALVREVALLPEPVAPPPAPATPWYEQGWVWGAAGAVVVGAVVAAVVLSAEGTPARDRPVHSLTFEPTR